MKRLLDMFFITALLAMLVSCSNNDTVDSDRNIACAETHVNIKGKSAETNINNDIVETMPVFEIVTENAKPVTSKEKYINGAITVSGDSGGFELTSEPIQIRGRGNQTWTVEEISFMI